MTEPMKTNPYMERLRLHADLLIERDDPIVRAVAVRHYKEPHQCIGAQWFRTAIADELRKGYKP